MTELTKEAHTKPACCFAGPQPKSLTFGGDEESPACMRLKQLLKEQVVHMIEAYGVTHFISSAYLGVGQYAAEIVLDLKKEYPGITLECVISSEKQAEYWSVAQRERYFTIVGQCDTETLLQHHYTKDCKRKRIEYMVNQSDYILAVWNGRRGDTRSFLSLARSQGQPVIVINPDTLEVRLHSVKD